MEKVPGKFFNDEAADLCVFNYDIENIMNRSKVVLEQYVISFLLEGHKEINFAGTKVTINNSKALIIAQGNCLMTEKGHGSEDYKSILLFFSKDKLSEWLSKQGLLSQSKRTPSSPYFTIEQDAFIKIFINSLALHFTMTEKLSKRLLESKFEELMTYLIHTYGAACIDFLVSSLQTDNTLSFKKTIDANKHNNLSLEEIAFLCNMSVSTFKRRFTEVYNGTPGKWFKQKRLEKAQQLLQNGKATPAEIFNSTGYKNLSHFSTAYKERFGKSPRQAVSN